ncbi:MAG: hypothetical protein ACK56I_25100, partial [bacterium]
IDHARRARQRGFQIGWTAVKVTQHAHDGRLWLAARANGNCPGRPLRFREHRRVARHLDPQGRMVCAPEHLAVADCRDALWYL